MSSPDPATPPLAQEDLAKDLLLRHLPRDEKGRPLLGRLPLICRIGKGGMGTVYYAIHPRLQVEVAVKVLPYHLLEQEPKLAERFQAEARLAASLRSDHIVGVLDVDQDQETHFLVMEYVSGQSAGAFLKRVRTGQGGLAEPAALDILLGAARGLAVAHGRGIIHRDIKPDNILIPKNASGGLDCSQAKLADLGLAKPEGGGQTLGTMSHVAMGTPGYMAPEQIEDARTAGPPADVFSMGATLYALLTGHAPFTGTSLGAILRETATKEPPPLPAGIRDVTRAFVDRCMAKDPARRFANGIELLRALEQLGRPSVRPVEEPQTLLSATAIQPPPLEKTVLQTTPPPPPPVEKPVRQEELKPPIERKEIAGPSRRWRKIALVVIVAALGVGGWQAYRHHQEARRYAFYMATLEARAETDREQAILLWKKAAALAVDPGDVGYADTAIDDLSRALDRRKEYDALARQARETISPKEALAAWDKASAFADDPDAAAEVKAAREALGGKPGKP